jgi:hypothetical protein
VKAVHYLPRILGYKQRINKEAILKVRVVESQVAEVGDADKFHILELFVAV